MANPKPNPPSKSRKGIPNKITRDLKEMILEALSCAGGVRYLTRQAEENPPAFLALIGKILPMQVQGSDGKALTIRVVTGVEADLEQGDKP